MSHEEILERLSDAINELDRSGKFGFADELFSVIQELKKEWGIEDE